MGFASDQGFRCYRYDVEDDSLIFDEGGIENEALHLLEALTKWREQLNDKEVSKIHHGSLVFIQGVPNTVQFSLPGRRNKLHSLPSTLGESF